MQRTLFLYIITRRQDIIKIQIWIINTLVNLGRTVTNQDSVPERMKNRLKSGYAGKHSIKNLQSVCLLSRNVTMKMNNILIINAILYVCGYYYDDQSKEDNMGRACGRHRNMTLTYGSVAL
jgi:hypothetical protein